MSFAAKYRGVCPECWDVILLGQEVEYRKVGGQHDKGDQVCHQICPEPELPLEYGVCEKCFMEKTPAGTCGCA